MKYILCFQTHQTKKSVVGVLIFACKTLRSEPEQRWRTERGGQRRREGENMCMYVWVCMCTRGFDKELEENAGCCCRGNRLPPTLFFNPFSSPLPFHLLSFTITVNLHLLMSYHSICPCLYLHPSLPLYVSLSLSLLPTLYNTNSFDSWAIESSSWLFILMVTHLSFCLHMCFVNSESLFAREQWQFVVKCDENQEVIVSVQVLFENLNTWVQQHVCITVLKT